MSEEKTAPCSTCRGTGLVVAYGGRFFAGPATLQAVGSRTFDCEEPECAAQRLRQRAVDMLGEEPRHPGVTGPVGVTGPGPTGVVGVTGWTHGLGSRNVGRNGPTGGLAAAAADATAAAWPGSKTP